MVADTHQNGAGDSHHLAYRSPKTYTVGGVLVLSNAIFRFLFRFGSRLYMALERSRRSGSETADAAALNGEWVLLRDALGAASLLECCPRSWAESACRPPAVALVASLCAQMRPGVREQNVSNV